MQQFLQENSQTAFSDDAAGYCIQHKRMCPTNLRSAFRFGRQHLEGEVAHSASSSEPLHKKARTTPAPWWTIAADSCPGLAGCDDKEENVNKYKVAVVDTFSPLPADRVVDEDYFSGSDGLGFGDHVRSVPRVMSWGSTVCKGYTPLGAQKRGAHESTRSRHIFVEQRRADFDAAREDHQFSHVSMGA